MRTLYAFLIIIFGSSAMADTFRVLNGDSVIDQSKWPEMVSISEAGTDPALTHHCGGTLINPSVVLTAAHCVFDYKKKPSKLQVLVGRTRLRDSGGEMIQARSIAIHPLYQSESKDYDVAIIRLEKALTTGTVLPYSGNETVLRPVGTILGWGVTDAEYLIRPNDLQEANIPIIDNNECEDRLGLDFNPNTMVCGGTLASDRFGTGAVDACFGDSGGPLIIQTNAGLRIYGLASWGFACGSDRVWTVYTKVAAFSEWINDMTTELTLLSPPKVAIQKNLLVCKRARWVGGNIGRRTYIWQDKSHRIIGRGNSIVSRGKKKVRCVESVKTDRGIRKAVSAFVN